MSAAERDSSRRRKRGGARNDILGDHFLASDSWLLSSDSFSSHYTPGVHIDHDRPRWDALGLAVVSEAEEQSAEFGARESLDQKLNTMPSVEASQRCGRRSQHTKTKAAIV
jgi:hypothetical protein